MMLAVVALSASIVVCNEAVPPPPVRRAMASWPFVPPSAGVATAATASGTPRTQVAKVTA